MAIDILWGDLSKEKQDEILLAFGSNMNWDVIPIITLDADIEE